MKKYLIVLAGVSLLSSATNAVSCPLKLKYAEMAEIERKGKIEKDGIELVFIPSERAPLIIKAQEKVKPDAGLITDDVLNSTTARCQYKLGTTKNLITVTAKEAVKEKFELPSQAAEAAPRSHSIDINTGD